MVIIGDRSMRVRVDKKLGVAVRYIAEIEFQHGIQFGR